MAGPPVAPELRAAGWAEATVVPAALRARAAGSVGHGVPVEVTGPERRAGRGWRSTRANGSTVEVWAGEVLDETTLRSYCFGAVHQALGWVRSEGVAVDDDGLVQDLTVRSFGVLAARDMPDGHGDDPSLRPAPGERIRRGVRRHRRRGVVGRRPGAPLAHPQGRAVSRPVGPYSPFVSAGGWVVTSGQIGIVTGERGPELVRRWDRRRADPGAGQRGRGARGRPGRRCPTW